MAIDSLWLSRKLFWVRKAIAKPWTLRLRSCFIHIFLTWTEVVPFTQEVYGVYTSTFLDTDGLKMALRHRKVSWSFEKRAPELIWDWSVHRPILTCQDYIKVFTVFLIRAVMVASSYTGDLWSSKRTESETSKTLVSCHSCKYDVNGP